MSRPRAIFIIGPSSTGKSTLCHALAQRLSIPPSAYIKEVARDVMRETGYTRKDVGTLDMQGAILAAQLSREDAALDPTSGHELVICDRSGIDPVVYAVLNANTKEDEEVRKSVLTDGRAFQDALERYRASTVLLLKPVAEWLVDDGVRSLDDREQCYEMFKKVLAWLDVPYMEMGEETMDLKERVDIVSGYVGA